MARHRILIIDDSREICRLIQSALLTLDSELDIIEVPSGEEAMLEIGHHLPDLFIVDIRLPGISGLEFLQKVQARHPDIKFIIITGLTDPKVIDSARKLAGDNFFTKPLRVNKILETVEHCLDLPKTITTTEATPDLPETTPLAQLYKRTNAQAVLWMEKSGAEIAVEGKATEEITSQTITQAMAQFHELGVWFSGILNERTPNSLHVFAAPGYDLLIAPVDDDSFIVLLVKSADALLQKKEALEAIRAAQTALQDRGNETKEEPSKKSKQKAPPQKTPGNDQVDFEKLLSNIDPRKSDVDPDNFWDKAVSENDTSSVTGPDLITYQQAHEMGLTPDEDG